MSDNPFLTLLQRQENCSGLQRTKPCDQKIYFTLNWRKRVGLKEAQRVFDFSVAKLSSGSKKKTDPRPDYFQERTCLDW